MTSEVEGLDLDALEKVARGVASIGSWRCDPNMLNGGLTVNDAVGSLADILSDGPGEYIATFDPPTVLRLLAALRAQAERVRVLEGAVGEAEVQITYLHEKFGETGSGNAVLAKIRRLIGHGEPARALLPATQAEES